MKFPPAIAALSLILSPMLPGWGGFGLRLLGFLVSLSYVYRERGDYLLDRELEERERRDKSEAIHSLELQLATRREELEEVERQLVEEAERTATEKQETINKLNGEIETLNALLEEGIAEIDQREALLKQKIDEYHGQKRKELEAIALQDEQELDKQAEVLEKKLEEDKRKFLEEWGLKERKYRDRIQFLEEEIVSLNWQLQAHERPQMPDGVELDQVAARRVIEILESFGVLADYRGSWIGENYLYVRVCPRKGGEEAIRGGNGKHLERIRLELNLADLPEVGRVPGAVEICLKPRYMMPFPAAGGDSTPYPAQHRKIDHPEVIDPDAIATLNRAYLQDFVEPSTPCNPYGDISETERDWIRYLWNFHKPRPIRNQKALILRVWGAKSGDGKRFTRARSRLREIAKELGIELRRRDGDE